METQPLIVEKMLNAAIGSVWKALTDKDQMRKWYFDVSDFEPQEEFEFQFSGKTEKGTTYIHHCKVTEVIPNKKLTYTWQYEGYEGISFVTFELFEEGEQTRLKLTHTGIESFPKHPDFAKNNFAQGWTYLIGTAIKEFVEKDA